MLVFSLFISIFLITGCDKKEKNRENSGSETVAEEDSDIPEEEGIQEDRDEAIKKINGYIKEVDNDKYLKEDIPKMKAFYKEKIQIIKKAKRNYDIEKIMRRDIPARRFNTLSRSDAENKYKRKIDRVIEEKLDIKRSVENENGEWVDTPEYTELNKFLDKYDKKFSNLKSKKEIEEQGKKLAKDVKKKYKKSIKVPTMKEVELDHKESTARKGWSED